jgi:hypothetical protein
MFIKILTPKNNSTVDKRCITAKGKSAFASMIQVYVQADDGKFYLQKPITVNKPFRWSAEIHLGDTNSANKAYKIAFVLSKERPESPLDKLDYKFVKYINVGVL